jgi:hypothetical protein
MGLVLFSFVSYYLYIYIFFFFFFFVTIVTTVTTFSPRYFQRFAMGDISRPLDPPFAYASENVVFCGYIGYMVTSQ